ncbi:epoxyqueuosine reductase QueH [Candidatus Gracilibacteria bacterium]|nr:epoxyqueuosine reductase QueH [Candidatus Gracilibacteria bacterium]MCF7856765.1 epoxyqueuosine reductase QueH [Candidatus Gracilibacteria bacterium]MCF7897053.1 epoxyqueuosine reductase QueH [Candidatus Gracilibacteria bacterium]
MSQNPTNLPRKKLLLHSCCAPCLTHPLNELAKDFEVVLFFYNPNIHPRAEYEVRLAEAKRYCRGSPDRDPALRGWKGCEILEGDYDSKNWFEKIKGLEDEPERGKRCKICYAIRLAKTAETAAELGFQAFATTLSISPHKNANWLNEIGKDLEQKYGVQYLESDWKKCDGFKKSLALSAEAKLKRQNYCGCIYSRRTDETKKASLKN